MDENELFAYNITLEKNSILIYPGTGHIKLVVYKKEWLKFQNY